MILLDELRVEMTGYRKDIAELGEVLNIKKARLRYFVLTKNI